MSELRRRVHVVIAFVCLSCLPAPAHQGDTERVSVSSSGEQGNGVSLYPSTNANGRFVAFTSASSNLVPGDTNGYVDVFVYDRALARVERVSVSSSGEQGDSVSGTGDSPSLSADGRFIVFSSDASNLVPGDTNGVNDVFVRDRLLRTTVMVSVTPDGRPGNGFSATHAITPDGRFVAFASDASDLVAGDTNNAGDVFVRDMVLSVTERVSVASSGEQAEIGAFRPAMSADGRFVAFESYSTNLVPDDTNLRSDVFVRDRLLGTTERVSISTDGQQGDGDVDENAVPAISADGRFVAFGTRAQNMAPGKRSAGFDVYVRNRLTHTTEMVSVAVAGEVWSGDCQHPSISADGRFVAFDTKNNGLTLGGTAASDDAFVRDRLLSTTSRVAVSSSGEQATGDVGLPGGHSISADGRFVTFSSNAWNLVPNDTSPFSDVFVHQLGADHAWPLVSGALVADSGVLPSFAAFEFRLPGQTEPVGLWEAEVGFDGTFECPAPIGVYDVSVKPTHWLRRTVANVDTTGGSVDVGALDLVNGDANGDNHIGMLDLAVVLLNFGDYDPMADLNGDGHAGFLDLAIVLMNFGLVGDP